MEKFNKFKTPERLESFPLEMYKIPGYENIRADKYFKSKDQDKLIEEKSKEVDIMEKLKTASREEKILLIEKALDCKDAETQINASRMIEDFPEEEQEILKNSAFKKIKQSLESEDSQDQVNAVRRIWSVFKKKQAPLIKEGLNSDSLKVKCEATDMIRYAPCGEKASLIKEALEKEGEVQLRAAKMTIFVPGKDRAELQNLIFEKIKKSFQEGNMEDQIISSRMINYASQRETLKKMVLEKVQQVFENGNKQEQSQVVEMIGFVPEEEKQALFKEAFKKGLGSKFIESSLYKKKTNLSDVDFAREDFDKTGSGLTLLGGSLKDKLVIRHIKPESFLAWQKLYEDYELWKENEFDYVPIEPIQSYRMNKNGTVSVFSGVLDMNLDEWLLKSGNMFEEELNQQKEKIKEVLSKANIDHGHAHETNFVLRFFRNENGEPDIKKVPRLYLIDFDQAKSC